MTGGTPPQLSQGPLRHLSTNTTRKGIQACVWCKNGLRQWWETKTWNGDSQESATPINTRCFSLFRSRGEAVNNNKLEMNKFPKFCNRSVSKKASWENLAPGYHLTMTSTVHLQELKMQSHKQETTTLHTKTTQEMEGIQKVRGSRNAMALARLYLWQSWPIRQPLGKLPTWNVVECRVIGKWWGGGLKREKDLCVCAIGGVNKACRCYPVTFCMLNLSRSMWLSLSYC